MNLRARVEQYLEAIDRGDHEAIASFFAPTGKRVHAAGVVQGRTAIRDRYRANHGALADRKHQRGPIRIDGDTAMVEYIETATHVGTFTSQYGDIPATHQAIEIRGCMVIESSDEGFTEVKLYSDTPYKLLIAAAAAEDAAP